MDAREYLVVCGHEPEEVAAAFPSSGGAHGSCHESDEVPDDLRHGSFRMHVDYWFQAR